MENILMIEDDRALRKALGWLFEPAGYSVEVAIATLTGLQPLRTTQPTVVLVTRTFNPRKILARLRAVERRAIRLTVEALGKNLFHRFVSQGKVRITGLLFAVI